ncbi:DUF4231 domain-containing protein [Streptomyces sp. NPDC102405]|jgi:hypothetical protein|uniref:DUF4231 domain-containing protein n=1 Tax=Streptomyces sp. NPDC102405 TaxID=3366170 RepID=UPI003816715C
MAETGPEPSVESGYALTLANDSYNWYSRAAIRSRRAYKFSETAILLVSGAIPFSVAVAPHITVIPAALGALAVVGSGLRSVYHWQDNYLRFSGAREAVEAERRRYHTGAEPYDDAATRDQLLAAEVSRIEQGEMNGWVKVVSERPKP